MFSHYLTRAILPIFKRKFRILFQVQSQRSYHVYSILLSWRTCILFSKISAWRIWFYEIWFSDFIFRFFHTSIWRTVEKLLSCLKWCFGNLNVGCATKLKPIKCFLIRLLLISTSTENAQGCQCCMSWISFQRSASYQNHNYMYVSYVTHLTHSALRNLGTKFSLVKFLLAY